MGYSRLLEAIVLRTVDVGEADRFCILFTKEAGRKAARAKGVRKTTSRMGGVLLPFRWVRAELREGETGSLIISAISAERDPGVTLHFVPFSRLAQGFELLIALTEDDEPLPEVFDLCRQFLEEAREETAREAARNPVPVFSLRLLHLLGHLPQSSEDERFARLPLHLQQAVRLAARTSSLTQLRERVPDDPALQRFLQAVLHEILPRPLRAEEIR